MPHLHDGYHWKLQLHYTRWKQQSHLQKPMKQCTKQRYLLKFTMINAPMCALSKEEYTKVQTLKGVREMWGNLIITYESSTTVKHNKIKLFIRQYEFFNMKDKKTYKVYLIYFISYRIRFAH